MAILEQVSIADANLGGNYGLSIGGDTILLDANGATISVGSLGYWSLSKNTGAYTLYIQKYNDDGTVNGDAVVVNTQMTNNAYYFQAATVLENGNIVLAWQEADGDMVSQIFQEDGTAVSTLATLDAVSGKIQSIGLKVVGLDTGGYAVTAYELVSANTYRLTAQIYDASGTPTGDAFLLTPNAAGNNATQYDVVALDGGFMVTMSSAKADSDGTQGVIGVVYANDGTQLAAEFPVNDVESGAQYMEEVVSLKSGGYAVTWTTYSDKTGEYTLSARVFSANGAALTGEMTVGGVSGAVYAGVSDAVALGDGSFLFVWTEANEDWSQYSYKAQRVDADGALHGDVMELPIENAGDFVKITETDNGVLHFAYLSYDPDTGNFTNAVETLAIYNAPLNVSLSANTVSESAAAGTVIGELSATDADGDALTFTLDDDADGLFDLVTENGVTKLVLSGTLDYETAATHEVNVSVTDGEYTTTETLSIAVGDALENTAPTDIAISSTSVKESARVGFVVGTLSATDAEGDAITWSLESGKGDNDDRFSLVENDDGTVSVVLKSALDVELGGTYDLVVTATDSNGAATTESITITAEEEYFKLSSSPTGYNYLSVTEAAEKGQELGYVMKFDDSFVPVSAELTDDADGKFALKTREVDGETRYYLVTNGALDYETEDSYSVTIEVENAAGETQEKSFEVEVLDAAEAGDTARGNITIDANTLVAGENGGVNWNTYLDDYWAKLGYWTPIFSPYGTGYNMSNPSPEFVYYNGETVLSMEGALAYIWTDPVTGQDVHVVAGSISDLVFGEGSYTDGVSDAELTISGLDLESGTTPDNRLSGEVNLVASAFMHGPNEATPAEFTFVKALLASYAQTFLGSSGADTYTGTLFGDTVKGNGGNDTFKGAAGGDVLQGGAGDDKLAGQAGADSIAGGAGADTLQGGGDVDVLTGGAGADKLYGGGGADQFVFSAVSQSSGKVYDTIYDFAKDDVIDLSGIDANTKKGGDQAFPFVGTDDFSKHAGELRFEKSKGSTVIEGDINGDGKSDFVLHLDDAVKFEAGHFAL